MILTEILHNKSKGENMKPCFQVEYENIENYLPTIYKNQLEDFINQSTKDIRTFIKSHNIIDADKLMQAAFPKEKKHDIFISHSHNDFKNALALAMYIDQKFDRVSFVDGLVWKSGDKILKEIDNRYCYNKDTRLYDYEKRNLSTAYIHAMLAHSIAHTMDRCRCVIFLNTPNSVNIEDGINYSTYSPWIFYELHMLEILRKRSSIETVKASAIAEDSESVVMEFDLNKTLEKIPYVSNISELDRKIKTIFKL